MASEIVDLKFVAYICSLFRLITSTLTLTFPVASKPFEFHKRIELICSMPIISNAEMQMNNKKECWTIWNYRNWKFFFIFCEAHKTTGTKHMCVRIRWKVESFFVPTSCGPNCQKRFSDFKQNLNFHEMLSIFVSIVICEIIYWQICLASVNTWKLRVFNANEKENKMLCYSFRLNENGVYESVSMKKRKIKREVKVTIKCSFAITKSA